MDYNAICWIELTYYKTITYGFIVGLFDPTDGIMVHKKPWLIVNL